MNHEDKLKLTTRIANFKDYQYMHIFDIIRSDPNCKYSSNSNGIFVNLKQLSDETLIAMDKYISVIEHKNAQEHNTERLEFSENIKTLNYEHVYHECYKDFSNYHKGIVKTQGIPM